MKALDSAAPRKILLASVTITPGIRLADDRASQALACDTVTNKLSADQAKDSVAR